MTLHKSSWRAAGPIRIGEFEAQPASNELRGPEGMVRLRPLLMDLLLRLAADPGCVVTRETLLADVWALRADDDEVLSSAIGDLRCVLGDDAIQPRYIETLPQAGYRLVAQVGETPRPISGPPGRKRSAL